MTLWLKSIGAAILTVLVASVTMGGLVYAIAKMTWWVFLVLFFGVIMVFAIAVLSDAYHTEFSKDKEKR